MENKSNLKCRDIILGAYALWHKWDLSIHIVETRTTTPNPSIRMACPVQISTMYTNWVEANNQTAAALTAKEYTTRYAYGLNACHCDPARLAQDIPNT